MPQLRLFNRRWYSTTDTQPVWSVLYGLLHVAVLVSTLVMSLMMHNSDYVCNMKTQISVFLYGMVVIVCLLVISDCMVFVSGLQGGPFEEKKRVLVRVALYALLSLHLILIGWTLYGTIIGYSGKTERSCWSSSACESIQYLVPEACVDVDTLKQRDATNVEETGFVELSEGCQYISDHRGKTTSCITAYMDLGVTFARDAYNTSLTPPFDINNTDVDCTLSEEYYNDLPLLNKSDYYLSDLLNWGEVFTEIVNTTKYSNYALDNLIIFALRQIGIINASAPLISTDKDYDAYENISSLAPWASCRALAKCGPVLDSKCSQWGVLLSLPDGRNEKALFLAVIWVSWGSIFLSMLLFYLIFNSNPDYTSSESWVRALEKVSSLFGSRTVLTDSMTEEGYTASEELGTLLAQLFGGIDMDLTDRILGVYLAGERMRWRRMRTVQQYLSRYGYTYEKRKKSWWRRCFQGTGIDGNHDELQITYDVNDMQGSLQEGSDIASQSPYKTSAPNGMIPTPFSLARGSNFGTDSTQSDPHPPVMDSLDSSLPTVPPGPISVAQSIVRLDTSCLQSFVDGSSETTTIGEGRGSSVISSNKKIRMMLPIDVRDLHVVPKIDTKSAARLYLDDCLGFVSETLLHNAYHYSWFAKAAYGLQQKRWKASKTGDCLKDSIDSILSSKFFPKWFGNLAGLEGRFRKRNFDAILKFTGIPAEDFLYVSYTSTTFGLLPYLVMLDRKMKKLIISIRGTVGLEDLVTDLLSTPVEIKTLLSPSIMEKLPKSKDGNAINVYGHQGIASSAKAILQSLRREGVLSTISEYENMRPDEMRKLASLRSRKFTEEVSNLSESSEVVFDLQRAQTAVYDALRGESFDVVITGHSLGAAVASLVAVSLKETYQTLECYAFNPPGGLVSPELSHITRDFCHSIIVGHDAISRLSMGNVRDLIDDVVYSLCRCKRPKLKILMDILLGNRRNPSTAPRTYCSFTKLDPSIKAILQEYTSHSLVHTQHLDSKPLVPMGEIVFLRPYPMHDEQGTEKTEWDAVFADPGDIVQEGIIISRSALRHHQIVAMQDAIKSSIENQKVDYETIL